MGYEKSAHMPIGDSFLRLAALVLLAFVAGSAVASEWEFADVGRVVAISDPHGDFEAMTGTLQQAGILDADLNWSGGESHLVITGDLLDRGPESRAIMDALMRIETEAEAAGGALHVLIGNHELLNLVGDLRYVAIEEYAAFADDEDPAERERWFRHEMGAETAEADSAALRATFDEKYPPGFFAHRKAFRGDGQYGSWLLEKPIIVVINDTAFVHGGLSPRVAEVGLQGINGEWMSDVRAYVGAFSVLTDAGLISVGEDFYSRGNALDAVPVGARREAEVVSAMETVQRLQSAEVHRRDSPLWYRGNVGCSPLVEHDRIDAALAAIGASRVVIGHTPTLNRQVLTRLDGKVTEIDTGMLNAYYGGAGHALVIEDGEMSVYDEHRGDTGAPSPHPRTVGRRDASVGADELARMLAAGDIVEQTPREDGSERLRINADGRTVDALFIPNPRRGFAPELAAYQLDRFLELDAIPVTVSRAVGGEEGVVQFYPEGLVDEARRSEQQLGGGASCPLEAQWGAMYAFDALIHNPGRRQQNIKYRPDNWQLVMDGNALTFGTQRGRPDYLKDVPLSIGERWQQRLQALDREAIEAQFADSLDRRRRRALEVRRDRLLDSIE